MTNLKQFPIDPVANSIAAHYVDYWHPTHENLGTSRQTETNTQKSETNLAMMKV